MKKSPLIIINIIFLLFSAISITTVSGTRLNASLPSNITTNTTLIIYANFSSIENSFVDNFTLSNLIDGSTTKNLTFSFNGNQSVHLNIPKSANVLNANISIKALAHYFTHIMEDSIISADWDNNNFLWVGLFHTNTNPSSNVLKLNPDLTVNASFSASLIFGLGVDGNYVYTCEWRPSTFNLAKRYQSNFSIIYEQTQTFTNDGACGGLEVVGDYIYVSAANLNKIYKLSKNNFSYLEDYTVHNISRTGDISYYNGTWWLTQALDSGYIAQFITGTDWYINESTKIILPGRTFGGAVRSLNSILVGHHLSAVLYEYYAYITNLTIVIGNNINVDYKNNTLWNGSQANTTVDLNVTAINSYILNCVRDEESNCQIPIIFSSNTAGKLEISNINITYLLNQSCDICIASDGICDTEWRTDNITTIHNFDYLSGNCFYSWNTSNYNDGIYNVSLRIKDAAYNAGISSKKITLDRTPPIIMLISPLNSSAYTKQSPITININTSTQATCKYSNLSEMVFSEMVVFNNTYQTSHNFSIEVTDNKIYNFYIKCTDEFGNINPLDYYFTFSTEWSTPLITLNESLPSNVITNTTLFLYANFSDSGNGFATNNSCEVCIASDGICDTEWTINNVINAYSTDYLNGNCSYSWNASNYNDGVYNVSIRIKDAAYNTGISSKKITLDRTPPAFSYAYPYDNGAFTENHTNPENITNSTLRLTFVYWVEDLSSIANCSLIFNNKINNTDIPIRKNYYRRFDLNISTVISGTQYYNWSIACTDIFDHKSSTDTRKFTVIVMSNFSGETTDLGTVNLSKIENLTFEQKSSGKIKFSEIVNLSGISDINKHVKISFNKIEINTSAFPALNKSATLSMYNLTYSNAPKIIRDGATCPETICRIVSYSNGTLTFNVTQFSAYTTEEAPADTGSSGGGSSSSSSGGGGSGGGGGGGGGTFYICNMDWQCREWSNCLNGWQTRACDFVKVPQHTQNASCPAESEQPEMNKICETKIESALTTQNQSNETKKSIAESSKTAETAPGIQIKGAKKGALGAITGAFARIAANPKAILEVKTAVLIGVAVLSLGIYYYFKPLKPKLRKFH